MIAAPVVGPRDPGRRPDGMIATMSDAPLTGTVALELADGRTMTPVDLQAEHLAITRKTF